MEIINKKTVLIVDNEPDILNMMAIMIDDSYSVMRANSGRDALEQLHKVEKKPDLILLDILMPDLDGWKLLEQIREDEQLKEIPIAMLTAAKPVSEKEYCIVKPVTQKELLEFIEKIFESRGK